MLFTERRSSVIIESDFETHLNESHQKGFDECSKTNNEDKDQIKRRFKDKAKNTFKRVFSVTSRNNSGDVMELKTYASEKSSKKTDNSVQKRRKSVHFGVEGDSKIKKRRLSFDVEFQSMHKPKVQNRRFSSYNVMKNAADDFQNKNTTNGIYLKNRRSSTTKQFPSPITESSSQNTSKSISNSYYAPRRRRIKSSGYLDDKTSPPTREDLLYNQDENKLKNNKNKEGADNANSLKILEQPSPKSALNILKTLNAAKLSENAENEHSSGSQTVSKFNIQKTPARPVRMPYRRRVAVSFSNFQSESPVVLSKFEPNKEFDSSF